MDERECGTLEGMRPPIFVRTLTDDERQALEQGLRSNDAFVLRRCQILLASARGERAPRIATYLGIDDQTVLDALHAFNAVGLACLQKKSSRAHRTRLVFSPEQAERLRALLQRSPRDFGKPDSLWTLEWVAEVSVAEGLDADAGERGDHPPDASCGWALSWKRAKHWITSPDPGYARKKSSATA